MSVRSKKMLYAVLGAVLGMLVSDPRAVAQPTAPSSVLPTGGRQALIDTSDSVLLLLDHQSGLFQTVKDIGVTELRNNTIMLNPAKDSCHHHRLRAQWAQRATYAGNPSVRPARGLCRQEV